MLVALHCFRNLTHSNKIVVLARDCLASHFCSILESDLNPEMRFDTNAM
jgi:hypothetical protein